MSSELPQDPETPTEVGLATQLLRKVSAGDSHAKDELYDVLYRELHRVAEAHMGKQHAAHTLQATALVNEAWLRIAKLSEWSARDRDHFLSIASRAMRSVLVDHARRRKTQKRGAELERIPLDAAVDRYEAQVGDLIGLDDALEHLEKEDATAARIVEMRFFGGLSMEEVAEALGVSLSTTERKWRLARMRLKAELEGE